MWETIGSILTSENALMILIFALIIAIAFFIMSKKGIVAVNTGKVRIGRDEQELTIVRNQSQFAYLYIMAIKGKILEEDSTEVQKKDAELILEKIYDKVVDWIHYNHISDTGMYIEIKKEEIKNFVYGFPIKDEFKTPEFKSRMEGWVEELILNLLKVRKEYSK